MQFFLRRSAPLLTAFAVMLSLVAPLASVAQDEPAAESTASDGVGVARISLIEGSVALQRGDSSDSLTAAPNAPILGGDYVTSGDTARAEIQLDGYSQVRLGHDVQMRFTHLDTNSRSIQLAAGTVDLRLLHGPDGTNTIDTPSITVKPQQGGSYRVTVTPDGQTLVTVRSGDAQIDTPQGQQDLQPGRTLVAQGEAANPSIQTEAAVALDDFDHFNADRDRAHAPAIAAGEYVNPNIDGVEDLSANGRWVTDGSYGHVWTPENVGPQWAPYRDGRWVWEEGYGWTWIASESWGWAPYHYGSWYNSPNYGWCWYPPQPRVYVPWRPALVAFIGFGGGGGFSLGFGGGNAFGQIGWVPLAPFEPYHPWWGNRYGNGGGTVINNITNVTNVTNITNVNVYKNVQYNGVSSVSSQRFIQGNFTRNVAVAAPQLREAHVFRGALPVVPTASNLRFTNSTATAAVGVRPALMQQSFAGNHAAIARTPFTTQRTALVSATHAALTPLHFKDAQTTPLVPDRTVERTMSPAPGAAARTERAALPAARTMSPVEHAALQDAHTNVTAAHPVSGAAAGSAWSRFNQTRTPQNAAEHANAPTGTTTDRIPSYAKTQPTSTQQNESHTLSTGTSKTPANDTYKAPVNDTYKAPANDTYKAPANDTYKAPATDTYKAPANGTYHTPAKYHAPYNPDRPASAQHANNASRAVHVNQSGNGANWHRYNNSRNSAPAAQLNQPKSQSARQPSAAAHSAAAEKSSAPAHENHQQPR